MKTKGYGKIEKISSGRYMYAAAPGGSGDAAATCSLPGGRLAFILSDGMGKGMKAAAESRTVLTWLRKLLKAGMAPALAIKIVNRLLIEKHGREEMFATIDLLIINKATGRANFYKMGSAASFLLRDNWVRAIEPKALPVGIISRVSLSRKTMYLRPGDLIVMVSDGITEADKADLGADWLKDFLIRNSRGKTMRFLAREITQLAMDKCPLGSMDDMTTIIIKVQ